MTSDPNRALASSDYGLIKNMEKIALIEELPNGIQKDREFNKIVYQKSSSSVYGKQKITAVNKVMVGNQMRKLCLR